MCPRLSPEFSSETVSILLECEERLISCESGILHSKLFLPYLNETQLAHYEAMRTCISKNLARRVKGGARDSGKSVDTDRPAEMQPTEHTVHRQAPYLIDEKTEKDYVRFGFTVFYVKSFEAKSIEAQNTRSNHRVETQSQ